MSDLLASASVAMDLPEELVQRSAGARAAENGTTVDEVLAAWAGGDAVVAAAPAPAADVTNVVKEAALEVEEISQVAAAVPTASVPATAHATTRAPGPDEVTAAEAIRFPEVVTVPTAGIKERTNFLIPGWLTAVMLIVPLFALFTLGSASTGTCGEATELATNVVTGEIVNCDGSRFTGSAVGGEGTNYIALGDDIYNGRAVTGVNCAGCHSANGQGAGTFPALTGVLTTFGACSDHAEWISLGTSGFQNTNRATYGDTAKAVGGAGNMPSFGGALSDEQIAAVAAFERVRFGGASGDAVLADCALGDESAETSGAESNGEVVPAGDS